MMSKSTGSGAKSFESTAERYSAVTAKIHQIQESAQADSESECDVEDDVRNGNLLMVDQLWLWSVDSSESSFRLQRYSEYLLMTFVQQRSQLSSRSGNLVHQRDHYFSKRI